MKSRWMRGTLVVALAGIALAGCAGVGMAPTDPLDGTSWLLVSIEKADPLPGIAISATFDEGSVHGSSGCNTFGAAYQITRDAINIREIQSTLRACVDPDDAMEQEQHFLALLADSDSFQISDGQLRLMSSGREMLAFVRHD